MTRPSPMCYFCYITSPQSFDDWTVVSHSCGEISWGATKQTRHKPTKQENKQRDNQASSQAANQATKQGGSKGASSQASKGAREEGVQNRERSFGLASSTGLHALVSSPLHRPSRGPCQASHHRCPLNRWTGRPA